MESQTDIEMKPSIDTAIKAQGEFHERGGIYSIRCERCEKLLKMTALNESAWKLSCECGLYEDTFRGI